MAVPKRGLGQAARRAEWGSDVGTVAEKLASGELGPSSLQEVHPAGLAFPHQPRTEIDADSEEFAALVESIQEHGVLEPLLVRRVVGGELELLAGGRRLEAAKRAGLKTVPVRILEGISDTRARAIAATENLARLDLPPWNEAQAVAAVREDLREETGVEPTQRALAARVGLNQRTISEDLQIVTALTSAVLKRARVDDYNVIRLPRTALLSAARRGSEDERAAALHQAVHGAPPERVATEVEEDRGDMSEPRSPAQLLRSHGIRIDGRRVERLDAEAAQQVLDALRPTLEAIRARAGLKRGAWRV